MTKISNQYSLTNILTADLANSRLGINNVSPTVALDVTGAGKFSSSVSATSLALNGSIANSGDATPFTIKQSGTSYNNAIYLERAGERNGYFMYIGGGADALTFRRNYFGTQSDVMSLTRDGNVGIGTTTPGYKFTIAPDFEGSTIQTYTNGSSGVNQGAIIRSWVYSTENYARYMDLVSIGNWDGTYGKSNMRFFTQDNSTTPAERMRITSGGNVLIGTSSDSGYKFEVNGGNSAVATRVISSGSTTAGTLWDGGGAPSFHAWSRPQDCGIGSNNFTGASILIKTGMTYGSFTTGTTRIEIQSGGAVIIPGSLSKGSGSFRIDHPLKPDTHQLVHSFIEGPQADLIYRGKLTLVNGKAEANIDEVSTMTEGTFEALCREVQCFTTNENGWDLVKGKVIGNIIYIESQNTNSTDEISWMVIGERKDKHMMDTEWTDEQGKVIVEPLKQK